MTAEDRTMKTFHIVNMTTAATASISGNSWKQAVKEHTGFTARNISRHGTLTVFTAGNTVYVLTYA